MITKLNQLEVTDHVRNHKYVTASSDRIQPRNSRSHTRLRSRTSANYFKPDFTTNGAITDKPDDGTINEYQTERHSTLRVYLTRNRIRQRTERFEPMVTEYAFETS